MPDTTQVTPALLDQDQSRAALGVITYLMQHTLPQARMQTQAQPNQELQQEQKAEGKQPQQSQPSEQQDKTAELKGQMDAMKTEHDAKIQSLVESQQKQIDELKQMIQQVIEQG